MKIFFTLCLTLPFVAASCHESTSAPTATPSVVVSDNEAPVDLKEAELERLVKSGPKMGLPKLLEYNREKLDAVYAAALKAAEDDQQREALVKSQAAWLAFYEADSVVASWNAKGGSYAYPASAQQKIYQLRTRMYQLSTPFMQGWQEVPRVPNPAK